MKDTLIRLLPEPLLNYAVRVSKWIRKIKLKKDSLLNRNITTAELIRDFKKIGIVPGDSVLVHASLSRIGYLRGGAQQLIEALIDYLGPSGNLLMPSFPASGRNFDYLLNNPVFDLLHTPSAMGIVSETFRKWKGVARSLHPTDSVCAFGPDADYFCEGHFGRQTPYDEFSPFRRVAEKKGKILMLGTTLNGACTSLHMLEDAVEFTYPVYLPELIKTEVIDAAGNHREMLTRVHNPEMSVQRNADPLVQIFEKENILKREKIGNASSMLIDSAEMLRVMIDYWNKHGICMYQPYLKSES